MRALVTGGAGFIGSHVVRELLHRGHEVVVLDNLSTGFVENLEDIQGPVQFIQGDVQNPDVVRSAMAGCAVVFHLAASVGNQRSIVDPIHDASVNLIGSLHVLNAARQSNVEKVVIASSAGIFGEPVRLPVDEEHPKDPGSPYGVTKLAAEHMAMVYHRLFGLGTVALRYFNVYGPLQRYDAYGNVIPIFAQHVMQRRPVTIYGDGNQTRDFVNVADVARATVAAGLVTKASGVYNIGSGSAVTLNELVQTMRDVTGIDIAVRYADPRPGDVRHSLTSLARASRDFHYQPSCGLEEGLHGYFDWFAGWVN